MGLGRSDCFSVLTSRAVCRLQKVSGPRLVDYLGVLTSRSVRRLQDVSGPRLVGLFRCPDKSLCLPSPGCEWASVSRIVWVS